VVILRVAGNFVALEVDAPLGVSELVVKSLADNFLDVPGLSGASILGSGEISLMLDASALSDESRRWSSARRTIRRNTVVVPPQSTCCEASQRCMDLPRGPSCSPAWGATVPRAAGN
jgi:chemotaxis protein histidine kinase CheA